MGLFYLIKQTSPYRLFEFDSVGVEYRELF